jgi:hypothetical protein
MANPEQRPKLGDRSLEGLAVRFRHFGRVEAPQLDSPLYAELCEGIATDPELLRLAAQTPTHQPPPNMIFAAAHYLLLRGARHELAAFYPGVSEAPRPAEPAFPAFRDFCLEQRPAIEQLLATRRTQTNVVRRCACLLPAFSQLDSPLALVEIGSSAGLNLHWDEYHYDYGDTRWGNPESPVPLRCELRGSIPLPKLPPEIPVVWRQGIDINPIDPSDSDAVTWLRALIWPEHLDRHARLDRALQIARERPVPVVAGDATVVLDQVLDAVPEEAALCVFVTHALYQFSRDARRSVYATLQRRARDRTVDFISMEGSGTDHSEVYWNRYRGRTRETFKLANAHPHGWWIEWLVDES